MPLGPLFYRTLETDKVVGLKTRRQNYGAKIELSNKACSELVWWKHNINPIQDEPFRGCLRMGGWGKKSPSPF